jgi:hypothetical protein
MYKVLNAKMSMIPFSKRKKNSLARIIRAAYRGSLLSSTRMSYIVQFTIKRETNFAKINRKEF